MAKKRRQLGGIDRLRSGRYRVRVTDDATGDRVSLGTFITKAWQHEWASARENVGLPELHFHDLRHVAATLAAETGAGVKEIMYRIGHSSPQAALRYQHASQRRDRSIADGISEIIRKTRPTQAGAASLGGQASAE